MGANKIRAATSQEATILSQMLLGLKCTNVVRYGAESWQFNLEDKVTLDVLCPWRILEKGSIAYGFGDQAEEESETSSPLGVELATRLLSDSTIVSVRLGSVGTLAIEFGSGACLEMFNTSSRFEAWACSNQSGLSVIANGGGEVDHWQIEDTRRLG